MTPPFGQNGRCRLFWIHPQLRDYRLALFTEIGRKYDAQFFFQLPSDTPNSLRFTNSTHESLRRMSFTDLRQMFARLRDCDIVLTSFLWSGYSVVAILMASVLGKHVIVWEEQSHRFPGLKSRIKRATMRLLARMTDAFFVLGNPQRDFLIWLGVSIEKIFVANEYPAICFGDISPKPIALPFAESQPVVLFIGRLIEVKGVTYLLQAVSQLTEQIPDLALLIVGDGPLRSALRNEATQLGLVNVHFAGWVEDVREKSYLLRRSALLAAPSVILDDGEAEGGPLVVLEALSAGRPVVGSALGSSTAFISDGENGFIVPERDPSALSAAMRQVLADPRAFANRTTEHFKRIPGHQNQVETIGRAIDYVATE